MSWLRFEVSPGLVSFPIQETQLARISDKLQYGKAAYNSSCYIDISIIFEIMLLNILLFLFLSFYKYDGLVEISGEILVLLAIEFFYRQGKAAVF